MWVREGYRKRKKLKLFGYQAVFQEVLIQKLVVENFEFCFWKFQIGTASSKHLKFLFETFRKQVEILKNFGSRFGHLFVCFSIFQFNKDFFLGPIHLEKKVNIF